MEAFLFSVLSIGAAEIGDRSLLAALLFGVSYRRPWPVFWGMACGLMANQLLSAVAGQWLFGLVPMHWHNVLIGTVFLVMSVWVLQREDDEMAPPRSGHHLFFTAAITFFMMEMADKTQVAVVGLMGVYQQLVPVVLGATVGILLITTPALWFGHRFADRLPVVMIQRLAAAMFLLLALWFFWGAWQGPNEGLDFG